MGVQRVEVVVERGELTSRGLVEWLAGLDPATAGVQLEQVVTWAREALADEDAVRAAPPAPPVQAPQQAQAWAPQPAPVPQPWGAPPPPPQQWAPPQQPPPQWGAPAAPQQQWGAPPPLNTTTGGLFTQVFAGGPPDMTNQQIQAQRGVVPSPFFDPNGSLGEKHGFVQPPGSGLLPGWDALSAGERISHFKALPRWAQEMLWSQMSHSQRRKFQQQRMNRPWTQLG